MLLCHSNPEPNRRGVYIDEDPGNPRPRQNLPEETPLVLALRRALDAVEDVIDLHNETSGESDCDCTLCFDCKALLYNLGGAESIISCQLTSVDEDKAEDYDEADAPLEVFTGKGA